VTGLDREAVRWAAHQRARDEMFRKDYMGFGVDELAKRLDSDDANALTTDQPTDPDRPTSCPECGFIGPPEVVTRHMARTGHGADPPDAEAEAELALTKAVAEKRYALGVLYLPNKLDAHREWADPEDLHEALIDFARHGDKKLRKQHGSEVIGEVIEAFVWPFDHDADLIQADGTVKKQRLPGGTAYIGAIFTPEGWREIRAGDRRGFSMGGSCIRVKEASPS
jgi:Putative phage serine protease XkdF